MELEANLLEQVLQDNDIEVVVINQTDSMYKFGEYVLKVPTENASAAKNLIEEYKNLEPNKTDE